MEHSNYSTSKATKKMIATAPCKLSAKVRETSDDAVDRC
eukprot:CAMPEP_0177469516 /NCGR_PEP_ID=MMETSP0369-20130122/19687_1 /TAXON_ID=447022 ORGANISM="Scrippsiella hangoei-like, Strain SHHI-4" /NCGR_SAMPLE_ID=MMETSP0369 /ASSEMBLY_ACC=CAM_ASM_000364 /LENGTH=38 /DNA_ID= /DNA_START= /DNA_END= /DNA_ORIENTATION=